MTHLAELQPALHSVAVQSSTVWTSSFEPQRLVCKRTKGFHLRRANGLNVKGVAFGKKHLKEAERLADRE